MNNEQGLSPAFSPQTWGPPTTAAAGWYPVGPYGGMRYFDGRSWSPSPLPSGDPASWTFPAPKPAPQTLPLIAGVVIYLILVAGLFVIDLLASALDIGSTSVAWAMVAIVCLLVIGEGPALAWASYVRRRWGDGTWKSIGLKWSWSDLGWGPLTWFTGMLALIVVRFALLLLHVPTASNLPVDSNHTPSVLGRVMLVALLVVIAPLTEEIIFRGVMLRAFLSRMHPVGAVVLQGLLFGMAHFSPRYGLGNIGLILVLSTFGAVLGAVAYLRQQIGATIIAHAIFNGLAAITFLATH